MTIQEFDNTRYGRGDRVIYHGKVCKVAQVEFEEKLFGILAEISGGDPDDVSWVRCENCEFLPFTLTQYSRK